MPFARSMGKKGKKKVIVIVAFISNFTAFTFCSKHENLENFKKRECIYQIELVK